MKTYVLRALWIGLLVVAACEEERPPGVSTDGGYRVDSGALDAALDSSTDALSPDVPSFDLPTIDVVVIDAPPDVRIIDAAPVCEDPPLAPSRPVATVCVSCRPPSVSEPAGGECSSDSECSEGVNGRCRVGIEGGFCDYDGCFTDDDCEPDELCECDATRGGGNACVIAGCHTDDDCGAFTCAPTLGECGHLLPPVAYYCHTADDACASDADCADGYCAYNTKFAYWACSTNECLE